MKSDFASYRFELAIWDPSTDAPLGQSAFLQQWRQGRIQQLPSWDSSTFLLTKDGKDYVGSAWNLGRIDWMVRQLAAAYEHLQKEEYALIRSAVDDQPYPPFFLFEPQGNEISISCFHIWVDPYARHFPIALFNENDPTPAELYAFIEKQRESLLMNPGPDNFVRVPFHREKLLQDFKREIQQADQILSLLNIPSR